MTSIEKKILAGVDAILGAEGMLAKTAGMTFSKQQYEYAQRAARGFTRFDAVGGRTAINMLQAATGTGKTLGYLVPLMLYAAYSRPRARVAISTFTRQLQKQILDKDAAQASQWVGQLTGVELSVALRLGIGNFVSASAAARLRDELAQEKTVSRFEDAIDFLDELIEWSEETDAHGVLIRSGLLYDFIQERNKVVLPYGIILSRIALSGAAPIEERAAYEAMVMASKNADVLIVNHALVAMNASRWSSLLDDPDGRRIAVLVCDEADRLADAAELVAGADMALHELLRTCQNIELPDVTTAARELYEYVVAMDVPNREALAIKNRSELAGRINRTLTVLRPVAASGVRFLEVVQDVTGEDNTKRRAATAAFVDAVQTLADVSMSIGRNDTTAIVSWSPVRRYPNLRIGHPNPAKVLNRMWEVPLQSKPREDGDLAPPRGYLDAVLFTSATMGTPGVDLPRAFDDLSRDVGVIRHARAGESGTIHNVCTDLYARYEPAVFGSMQFVLADPRAPLPTARDDGDSDRRSTEPLWLDYAAMVIRAAKAAGGRTLALSLSWADTIALGERLKDLPHLLVHSQGHPLQEMKERLAATPGATLISPAAWEGFDLPNCLQQLVITRIPYSPPDTAGDLIRRVDLEARGFSADQIERIGHAASETATRRKLAQGIGRGIRSKTDSVTLWIADPRFPLPEEWQGVLDEVLLAAMLAPTRRRVRTGLRDCIPQRFLASTYPKARLCLLDGSIHTPV